MPGFEELNDTVTLAAQMQSDERGPAVLINVFTVDASEIEDLIAAWTHDANFMKEQPGYISTQLHKGIAGSSTLVNCAVWESVESFRAAFEKPEFQKRISAYPESAVSRPHLLRKLDVPGLCVA